MKTVKTVRLSAKIKAASLRNSNRDKSNATIIKWDVSQLTKEDRAELLIKANILDANGNLVKRFFSAENIKKDKEYRQVKISPSS